MSKRIGIVVLLAVGVLGAIGFWFYTTSVPVGFVNDTAATVFTADCGEDSAKIPPGRSVVLRVYEHTHNCTIDGTHGNIIGCLALPSPLKPHAVVRVSAAKPVSRDHPCETVR